MEKRNDKQITTEKILSHGQKAFTNDDLNQLWKFFDEQINTLLETDPLKALEFQNDKALYFTVLTYGLRVNEICNLKINDLFYSYPDSEWGSFCGLLIRHSKTPRKFKQRFNVTEDSLNMLKWYVEEIRPKLNQDNVDYLFLTTRGHQLNKHKVSKRFYCYLRASGISDSSYSINSLRYTYIHLLAKISDMPVSFINQQIRHSNYLS